MANVSRTAIAGWVGWALDACFSPACAACTGPLGPDRRGPVCVACWSAIRAVSQPWCDRCGEPFRSWRRLPGGDTTCARCRAHPPHFDHARACGLYEGALRHIVHALKYRGHQSLGAPLGALMRETGRDWLMHADVVVPVPLHPWRRLRRGFNQADILACALGRPVWRALRRRRLGAPQATLSSDERLANVRGAYGVSRSAGRMTRARPRAVVLVDDVMTTGATLDACSQVLLDAGVEWIAALTVARAVHLSVPSGEATPRPRPPRGPRLSTLRR